MGFFKRILSVRDYEDDIEYEQDSDDHPILKIRTTVDVFEKDGTLVLSGDIMEVNDNMIVLERMPGCLSLALLDLNTKVCIRGYASGNKPFCYSGFVRNSSRVKCEIRDLEKEYMDEKRREFRIRVNHPAQLMSSEESDSEACVLLNISTGGACVRSEFAHKEDDVILLHADFGGTVVHMKGLIIRVSPVGRMPNWHDYGILFPSLNEKDLSEFTGKLYKIQGFLRKNMR